MEREGEGSIGNYKITLVKVSDNLVTIVLGLTLTLILQDSEYATSERMVGMLSMAAEELEVPLYYEIPRLTNIVKLSQEKLTFYTSAILNAGYQFSLR